MGGEVDQNVGRLQHRIAVEANGRGFAVLAGLVLELGHTVEPADAGDTIKDPRELGVSADLRLVEDDRVFRVDPGSEKSRGDFPGRSGQLGRILPRGNRVQIDDAVDALVVVLQVGEVTDGAEVVAKVQPAGGLNPGENPRFGRTGLGHGAAP